MCGRMSTVYEWEDVESEFNIDKVMSEFHPRYNLAPSQDTPVIIQGSTIFDNFKWGFLPVWAKDTKMAQINARAETIAEKPFYKNSFRKHRCLIPVSSFFEWDGSKTPHLIKLKKKNIFALAGIFSYWNDTPTVAIITTEANEFMKEMHHRMPVIIEKKNYKKWIDKDNDDYDSLMKMLAPFDSSKMEQWVVDKKVNSPKNNGSEVIQKISRQSTL